ncbi:MAG: InlB B-repeat-containing protein, partial [Muribaculaceae bacterium]|nr:InlB B-repeat-containing protein [Muribaculaceae bacterium]
INSYQAVFRLDGEVIATMTIDYGAAIEAPAVPEKEGYTFSWQDLPETMPAHDIEIEGIYTVNSYQAVFRIDDETVKTMSLDYGTVIEAPEVPEKEGYTFSGWQDLPETMPAHDIVVEGSYIPNLYNAIFVIDGEIIATLSVEYGAVINAPAAPEKEGYTFTGWQDLPETMPAHDIILTGTYVDSDGKYNAVFMIDGETVATILVEGGTAIELPEAPEKEGYTFDGWQDVPETMPDHDVVINGSYTVNSYTVTFVIDGEIFETLSVEYGAVINAPAAPEKEDYTFTGWENLPETMPAHDIEVTGTYVDSDGKYNAVFMIDGETVATILVEGGTAIELPDAPEKEGYTFAGWQDVPETMPNHDVVINGSYTVNSYEVIFVVNGEVIETRSVEYGSVIEAPEMPEREGYTFSGWLNLPETMPAQSMEIVGNYHPNLYTATFIIDGEVFEHVSAEYGSVITVPVIPEKEDYTFSGWSDLPATMPAHDIEVTGNYIYSPDIFKAVFVIDGEIFETLTLEPGDAITAPAAPEKEGYTFAGWQDVPETMPNHDVVIMGSYTVNSYNAVFIIDGEVIETLSVEYGAVINAPAAPEKEDYTFNGWSNLPETMPAHDIEVTGSYTYSVVMFNAVFMIDGETYATIPVEAGESVELPAEPFREGYTFSGWLDIPETMPHHDIVINGSYTVNTYTVVFMIGDEVIDTRRVDYGAAIETPEAPEKEGYIFTGWQSVPPTMPATDLVISGSYEAVYHLLVYLNGSVYVDEWLKYGTKIVIPEPEIPEGWQFDGWDTEIPETMPDHDVIIYGTLSVLSVIDAIAAESDDSLTIYDLNGALLFRGAKAADVKDQLTPGVYIINGQKVMVK